MTNVFLDLSGNVSLHDHIPHSGEIPVRGSSSPGSALPLYILLSTLCCSRNALLTSLHSSKLLNSNHQ